MSEPGKYEPIKRQQPATFEPVEAQSPAPDEPATFEPVDKLEALKAEMAAKFKGMDENLGKIDEAQGPQPDAKQPPIANAKNRFRDMLREFGEGLADIRPFIPKSNTLFHSVAGVMGHFAEREQKKEREGERREDRESVTRSRDARTARDVAYTDFLKTWKVPPDLAMKAAGMSQGGPQTGVPASPAAQGGPQTGGMADTGGVPAGVAQAAQAAMPAPAQGIQPPDGDDPGGAAGAVSAPFSPPPVPPSLAASASSVVSAFSAASRPGPASAISTPSYAEALAGGGDGGGNSGGSELRDILGVLREILDAVKALKNQGSGDNEEDESEEEENRIPKFDKEKLGNLRVNQGSPQPQGGGGGVPVGTPTRPQQDSSALDSITAVINVAKIVASLA